VTGCVDQQPAMREAREINYASSIDLILLWASNIKILRKQKVILSLQRFRFREKNRRAGLKFPIRAESPKRCHC